LLLKSINLHINRGGDVVDNALAMAGVCPADADRDMAPVDTSKISRNTLKPGGGAGL